MNTRDGWGSPPNIEMYKMKKFMLAIQGEVCDNNTTIDPMDQFYRRNP